MIETGSGRCDSSELQGCYPLVSLDVRWEVMVSGRRLQGVERAKSVDWSARAEAGRPHETARDGQHHGSEEVDGGPESTRKHEHVGQPSCNAKTGLINPPPHMVGQQGQEGMRYHS